MRIERQLSPDLNVSWKQLESGARIPWHDHGRATLCVVIGGGIEEEDVHGTRARTIGDLVFRPDPERHRDSIGAAGAEMLVIEIGAEALQSLVELGLPRTPRYGSSRRAAGLARLARAELRSAEAASRIALLGLTYDLLALVVPEHRPAALPPAWLARVRNRLLDDLRATPTLADLASVEQVSPQRLARAFQRHYRVSFSAFLRRARVERAMQLLERSGRSLADVAQEAGFCDQSHLTNVFKRLTGTTPAVFRRRTRAQSR